MKKLKTFKEACVSLGYDHEKVIPDFSCCPEKDRKAFEANVKLVIICDALNRTENKGEEWFPNWDDLNEGKFIPWFKAGSSGFRYSDYGHWRTVTTVGSRLCFKTSDLAIFAGEHFLDLYKAAYEK